MPRTIGVDIGGTGVRAGVVADDGTLGAVHARAHEDREVSTIVEGVAAAVARLGGADAVGVGVPGFVRDGTVLGSPNFPQWKDVPLAKILSEKLGVRVVVENDANNAALGAWHQRGAKGDLLLLTLGTGVGGGAVIDGRMLRGSGGTGAEFGHAWVGGDVVCACGGLGCLETWIGNRALVRMAEQHGVFAESGQDVVTAASRGEAWAESVLAVSGLALGRALTTFVNILNPDVILLCGGLSVAERWLDPPARKWLTQNGIKPSVERAQIVWEGRADPFAILGAAMAAR